MTATCAERAASRSATRRSRERGWECGIRGGSAGKVAEPSQPGNGTAVLGMALAFLPADAGHGLFSSHAPCLLFAPLARLNDAAKSKIRAVEDYFALAFKSIRFIFARPFYARDVVQQMDEIGVKSLGIVLLTGLFTGMVL